MSKQDLLSFTAGVLAIILVTLGVSQLTRLNGAKTAQMTSDICSSCYIFWYNTTVKTFASDTILLRTDTHGNTERFSAETIKQNDTFVMYKCMLCSCCNQLTLTKNDTFKKKPN